MAVTPVKLLPRGGAAPTGDVADRSNLTRAQFLMWLGQQMDPDIPLYNMIQTFRIAGAVDPSAFDRAWRSVVRDSDALHSTIAVEGGVPQRILADGPQRGLEIVDLREAADAESAARTWVDDRKVRPLALDEQLWDTALLITADDVAIWYLCMHHIVTDGQSFALTYQAMNERYAIELERPGEEPTALPQYSDYVEAERDFRSSERHRRSREHWLDKVAQPHGDTAFYGRTLSHRSTATDRLVIDIDEERSARVREVAGTPEFASISGELSISVVWASVLFATLHRVTDTTSIRVGTPFLGRSSAFRGTIGLFIEIGVLDVEIEPGDTFASLGSRLLRSTIDGVRHARPGVSSAELNRSYDVLLNNVTSRFDDFAGCPVTTEWVHTGHGDRDHALRLQVSNFDENGVFRLHFDVNAELFGETERAWLLEQFDVVLDALLDDPLQPLGAFDLVRGDDRQRTLVEFNDTNAPYPSDASVISLFDAQVESTPDSIAAEDATRSVTYRELAAESGAVATELLDRGVAPGDLVALYARRSVDVLAGILGVLRVGAAYVPIDPSYPAERRRFMLADAAPTAIVVAGADADELGPTDMPILDVAAIDLRSAEHDADVLDLTRDSSELAYVIYTSGSTGTPKGTELTHRGLVNYVWWAKRTYQPDGPLDFALYSSLAFDLTITSVFVPLLSGGRVVVYDRPGGRDGLEIIDVIEDDRVDIVKLTPAHLSLLIESKVECRRIKRLIVGGENLRTDLATAVGAVFPEGVEIYNEYGPTEAVVGCMVHRFDRTTDRGPSVPIGNPAANSRLYVLDRYDRPVPPGVVGEMVVSSDGVARGYRNRPDLTAERFGDDPLRPGARLYRTGDLARWGADGRLEFLGRNDHQVKIRGARVEPGEVEAAITAHPHVEAAVVDAMSFGDLAAEHVEHCITCGLPSNYPGSDIGEAGDCADCRAFAIHRDDVDRYFRTPDDLQRAIDTVRDRAASRRYDCLVLVSGGKDSTYMLYQLVRSHGVRPLVFTLDNGFIAEAALDNVRQACADLDVDLHIASTPHMNAIFADSLERHANVCDGCYKTIYTLSMQLARDHDIETIVTGLSRGQLFETRLADTFAAGEFDTERIDAWVMEARKAYHHIDDAVYELLETDLFNDDSIFRDIQFVDYYRYVDVDLEELYRYLHAETVWTRPPDTGRSTNCLINDVGIYVHNKQRGYHNYALPYSWDVRLGHKRREAAMDELDDDIDLERVRDTLHAIGKGQLFDDLRAEQRLVAYYTSSALVSSSDLRLHLAERLPEYMVPSYLVRLDELPLTINGKVDRNALPDPRTIRQSDARYRAPRTEIERRLVEVWRDALHIPTVGVDDNFFDLGGDSITSIQIVTAIRQFGWALTARDVFAHQTIAELARVAERQALVVDTVDGVVGDVVSINEADLARVRSQLESSGGFDRVEDIYPLTPTQLGMLYHTLRTSARAYFGQATCALDGDVDATRFRDAWNVVCRRHPATRVRFLWSGLDEPVQVVQRDGEPPWEQQDWRGVPADECRARFDLLLEQQRNVGFDLAVGSLMNLTLVRTDERHLLIWNSHHALLDGWSAHLLFDEVLEVYEQLGHGAVGESSGVRPFSDHVRWMANRDTAAADEWWKRRLDGVEAASAIPFDSSARDGGGVPDHVIRRLPAGLTEQVERFTRDQRVTLSSLATAAWSLVLARLGRADDVLFGTTVSGREDTDADAARMIGMFINTLPTRVVIEGEAEVGNWLRSIQRDAIEARRHGHVALADLQRLTGIPTSQALFDSIVVVENYPTSVIASTHPLRPRELEIGAPSNFALAILVHPGDDIRLEAVHETERFERGDVERLLGCFEQAMTALTGDAHRRLEELDIVPPHERHEVRAWSVGPSSPPADRAVHELIAAHATDNPDGTAIIDAEGVTTNRELDCRARAIGQELRRRGVRRGDCVGVVTGTSADHIAAVLGIFRAGAVYVPIDATVPPARLASMIEQTHLTVVVAERGFSAPAGTSIDVVDPAHVPPSDFTDLDFPIGGDDLAYVIYTSGSTGMPKGVAVTHANLANSTTVRSDVYDEAPGTFLLVSPLAFDSSMVGLFWTLCSGGTIVLPNDDQRHQLRALAELVERHAVTHMLALPSLYSSLLDEHQHGQLASLRTVIVAGEPCPASLPSMHFDMCPSAELYNEYGPTEATVWSHASRLARTTVEAVPIGVPIPNSVGLVLDLHDHPTPVGIAGELVVGGQGVAAGYLARPDLTDESFVELPQFGDLAARFYRTGDLVRWNERGELEFVGRVDEQVKIRGHRVELAEIDAVALSTPAVRSAAVVVIDAPGGARERLVGCYVAADPFDESRLRQTLEDRLPPYMVPGTLLRLDELPTTSTGKIDRSALEAIARIRSAPPTTETRPPNTDLERTLLAIWSAVLGRPDVTVDDDFFDLGGNSLDAMRVFARVERATGREILLSTLFEAPTIATFAALIDREPPPSDNTCLVPIKPTGLKRPFFYVAPYEVSVLELGKIGRHFDTDRPFFGLQPAGLLEGETVHTTVPEMAAHYVDAMKSLQPRGPYLIGGHCDGAWVAHEMARQLADRGDEIRALTVVDMPPPSDEIPSTNGVVRLADRLRYYGRDGRLLAAIRWQLRMRIDKALLLRFGSATSRRVRSVRIAHEAALERYEFRHDHRVPVHLIRSTELAVLMDEISWYEGLREGPNEVEITDITSTHARLLREPETIELAEVIGHHLDDVDR